jgi:hypothetical protein
MTLQLVCWRCLKMILPAGLFLGLAAVSLFSSLGVSVNAPQWIQTIAHEIQAACRDAGTQWMVAACLFGYFVVFVVLEAKSNISGLNSEVKDHPKTRTVTRISLSPAGVERRKTSSLFGLFRGQVANPNFWLAGFVVLVLLRYAFDYTNAAKSLQVVVLLTGIVFGKGIALWAAWKPSPSLNPREVSAPASIFNLQSSSRQSVILSFLVLLLACASLLHPERGMEFFYRGQQRWTGPWDNPNLFGLLMGAGLTLAFGLFVSGFRVQGSGLKSETFNLRPSTSHVVCWMKRVFYFSAAVFCGIGLVKSYSRGAWLGTVLGMGFLVWKWINQTHLVPAPSLRPTGGERGPFPSLSNSEPQASILHSQPSTVAPLSWLRRNWFPFSILILSIFVISFWLFRHTEAPLARRLFSVGNPNDFSWRNRVEAWEGAGRMVLAQPLTGFGWDKGEEVYSKQYRAARLEDSAAIQLNDYLTIGISVGVPALGCLLAYLALTWFQVSSFRFQGIKGETLDFGPKTLDSVPTICFGGVIVLMVGFWFDGGLFKLPTAVAFWVLIEQARRADIPVCQFGRLSSRLVQEHLAEKHGTGMSRETTGRKTCSTFLLRWFAGLVAVIALALTVLHLITPQLTVSERTLSLARRLIVPTREQSDFEYLASKSIWFGQPLKILLQHAHLANYNRTLVNWKLDDQLYRDFVLSPEIAPLPGLAATLTPSDGERDGVRGVDEMNWRRLLWEFFYPRIRKESSLEAAAEIVTRNLRERIKMKVGDGVGISLLQNWQQGQASEREFQNLCVATLRSGGIPARLSTAGQAEFWSGTEWKLVPQAALRDLPSRPGGARKD